MTTCTFRSGIRCEISAGLYAGHTPCTDEACAACDKQENPRAVNAVTVSLALSGASAPIDGPAARDIMAKYGHLLKRESPEQAEARTAARAARLKAINDGTGPGSQLHHLLATLGIHPGESCPCLTLAEKMNSWGVEGCREYRDEIVADIKSRKDEYGWAAKLGAAAAVAMRPALAWRLSITDPYGSLVDEAIRRAEQAGAKPTTPGQPATQAQPKKMILSTDLPPGDILTLTAAVESLHATYPGQYLTDVRTKHSAIWQNNPHVTPLKDSEAVTIPMHYHEGPASINVCNQVLAPFLGAYTDWLARAINRPLRLKTNRPSVYLTDEEKATVPAIVASDPRPTWLVCAGIKADWTTKQWPVEYYQAVIDATKDLIHWVQIGLKQHDHPRLENVESMLDTGPPMRELLVLAYHAAGGLGPITFLQHVMAAHNRHYVAIVGGREPPAWVQYQRQHTFHTVGQLDCCKDKACWKMRVQPRGDNATVGSGDRKRKTDESLCARPLVGQFSRPVADCMAMIQPGEVIPVIQRLSTGVRA